MPFFPEGVDIGFSQPPHPIPPSACLPRSRSGPGPVGRGGGAGEGLV